MTKKHKRIVRSILTCALSTIVFASCGSDMVETASNGVTSNPAEKKVSEVVAERSFAKILSVAAAKDASLRIFLKQEAQKQFDKDYDVFYPYVKDKVIKQGKTLRDILVECSSEEEISAIENSVPLLTIMIPDLGSFNAFSVNKWNPSQAQIATTYAAGNDNSVFFAEGDSLLSLPAGSLPDFPFLVVKSNERMKVVGSTSSTRVGNAPLHYEFVDPAFDGTKVNQTRSSYYDEDNSEVAPEEVPYLKKEQLDSRCIEAYNLAKNNRYLIDREYIYYNLSPQNPSNGKLDSHVREKLYMFRVSPSKYSQIIDEHSKEDPKLENDVFYKKWHPSTEQIAKDLWTNGAFEFVFLSYKGGNSLVKTKPISVKGSDLFYISKFHVRYKHHTAFRHSKWWYSTTPDDLKGKWVDLSSMDMYIADAWDLTNTPLSYYIKIIEKDNGQLKTTTNSYTVSFVAKSEFGLSDGKEPKFNLGFSGQSTTQQTYTVSYQYKDEDDELGNILLNFKDPVIRSDKYATSKGYQVYSLNTGSIDLVIAPTRIR